jgi:HAD superfamily hydrolase (TIGR01509 family)
MATKGVLFDVDGTLVDSNYLHVVAWWHAFRAHGHDVSMTDLHRAVGQGSDRLVETILGRDDRSVADAHGDFYGAHFYELRAFPDAADLLRACKKGGLAVVLATSASEKEAGHLTDALGADDAVDVVTTKDDAGSSKPAPGIIHTALDKAGLSPGDALLVGDTVWDVEAAGRAGLPCIAVLSGGIGAAELRDAGAVAVYEHVADLLSELDRSPIGALLRAS